MEPSLLPAELPKPGLFAPKAEKALHKAIEKNDPRAIVAVGNEYAEHRAVAHAIASFMLVGSDSAEAKRLLSGICASGADPQADPFAQKYLASSKVWVEIARGVMGTLPLDLDAVGLMLAELHQADGDLPAAIDTVEHVEPSHYAAVSLAELYSLTGRHNDVVQLTEGVANVDDGSALLCVFRAQALNELGYHDAALAAFKEALRSRSRAPEIRHLALSERSRTYESLGRRAMARKDLERILAEDSTYEGLSKRLESVRSGKKEQED